MKNIFRIFSTQGNRIAKRVSQKSDFAIEGSKNTKETLSINHIKLMLCEFFETWCLSGITFF